MAKKNNSKKVRGQRSSVLDAQDRHVLCESAEDMDHSNELEVDAGISNESPALGKARRIAAAITRFKESKKGQKQKALPLRQKHKAFPLGQKQKSPLLVSLDQPRRLERVEDEHDDEDYNPDEEIDDEEIEDDNSEDGGEFGGTDEPITLEMNGTVELENYAQSNEQGKKSEYKALIDLQTGKPIVMIEDGVFVDYEIGRNSLEIMRKFYCGPWNRWEDVPVHAKDGMWMKFKEEHTLLPGQEDLVKAFWYAYLKRRLTTSLGRVRRDQIKKAKGNIARARNMPPKWISEENWHILFNLWTSEKWKNRSEANKKNKLSTKCATISKNCGGSIPFKTHEKRLKKKLGRNPTQVECFDRTHRTNQGKGAFVDDRSKTVHDKYKSMLSQKYVDGPSPPLVLDYDLWKEASESQNYGLSSSHKVRGNCSKLASHSTSVNQGLELYTREELQQILHGEKEKWQEEVVLKMREEFGLQRSNGEQTFNGTPNLALPGDK